MPLYEIHITVQPEDLFALKLFCHGNKDIKLILIVSHDDITQPMVSIWRTADLETVSDYANTIASLMARAGMTVIRVKIEIVTNEFTNRPSLKFLYHEIHAKVTCSNNDIACRYPELLQLSKKHNAVVSISALKEAITPIVTLRIMHTTPHEDCCKLYNNLSADLINNNFTIIKVQNEYVISDSNPGIDHLEIVD